MRAAMTASRPSPAISRELAGELRRRHLEFLQARLVSPAARDEWIRGVADAWQALLATRWRDALEPGEVARVLQALLDADVVRSLVAPIAREGQRQVLEAIREHETPVGDHVPAEARRAIDALLERPGLVPDALVRKLFEQQVVEDAIHDTLYEAITQFEATVNPFFAEWGLPAILRRMPIGGSLILSSMEAIRAEFDRRLEPEIRKFLGAFSRRARTELTEFFLSRGADPRFVELRRNLVAFLYSRSIAELVSGVDDEAARVAARAAEEIAVAALTRVREERGLERAAEALLDEHGDRTIGEWLDGVGASGRPHVEAVAAALWPFVERALASRAVGAELERLTGEFYDSIAAG